jgi:hypothetical protein
MRGYRPGVAPNDSGLVATNINPTTAIIILPSNKTSWRLSCTRLNEWSHHATLVEILKSYVHEIQTNLAIDLYHEEYTK